MSKPLESSVPPVTSPAWRCYATGKDPSKLGVYWWRQINRETKEYVGAPDIPLKSKCYWEYLSDRGDEVAVLGIPLNTPPREVNGKLVLGGPYADEDSYTYPRDLKHKLENQFNYKLHPSTDPASADEPTDQDVIDDLESMIHQRFDVAEWMLEDSPDLLNITLFYINHLQHMAWKSPEVKKLWEVVDKRLGELLNESHNIIIHSDHGLHKVSNVFYLNSWLESEGYLKLKSSEEGYQKSIWYTAKRLMNKLIDQQKLRNHLPTKFVEKLSIQTSGRIVDPSKYESLIDFEESKAVSLPHGLIYVLSDDREKTSKNIQKNLEQLTLPNSSKNVFDEVRMLDQEYSNWNENESPDLFCRWNKGVEVKDRNADDPTRQFGPPQKFKADNDFYGILLAKGPDISEDEFEENARLYDLAPSLLHLLGHPVPTDMDGKVLHDLYAKNSNASSRKIKNIKGEYVGGQNLTRDGQVEDRLQDLGYLE